MTLYSRIFDLGLRRIPAETAHRLGFGLIRFVGSVGVLRWLVGRVLVVRDPVLRTRVLGVDLVGPLGLAAGFDKDAEAVEAWGALGFGHVEVGSVTARAQPGNPAPRLFRLTDERALINRMGFNNHGAGAAADRLRRRASRLPVAVNIGKTRTADDPVADYAWSAHLLGPLADWVVVNVSSPNTPGLRDLQAVAALRPVLTAVLAAVRGPVLVKIAPDLSDDDIDAVADLALELGLAGIVATNTTVRRDGPAPSEAGGLSGPPVAARSVEVLRRLRRRVGTSLVLVSVGGIETADDAWERIVGGAALVQGYTGFVYHGPLWARRVHRGLAARLRAEGFASVADAVGSAVPA